MEDKKSQRLNVILSIDNYNWLKKRSSEMGVSMSGFMSMALDHYRMQQMVVNNMEALLEAEKRMSAKEE